MNAEKAMKIGAKRLNTKLSDEMPKRKQKHKCTKAFDKMPK